MNTFSHVPPGFRFHPTEEELVDYYLRRKINSKRIDLDIIKDVDLYRIEPWDLQELCRIGTEERDEWYFFSHKDKKYPTGTRTNRATAAGFWKATGRDKAIYSKHDLIGMRKTLVFYKGRAPNGQKSDWIMHEYRLETDENGAPQEEGWVVCRVFKKKIASTQKHSEHDSPIWYEDHVSFMPDMDSPKQHHHSYYNHPYNNNNNNNNNNINNNNSNNTSCKNSKMEIISYLQYSGIPSDNNNHHHFLHQLPLLESPKLLQPQASSFEGGALNVNPRSNFDHNFQTNTNLFGNNINISEVLSEDQVTDWRVLDKFVASQLSQEEVVSKENDSVIINAAIQESNNMNIGGDLNSKQEIMQENNASTSSSSCPIDLWK
ncbi:hypothetical protein ABFS82_06G116300 [Erythranthe guttata]|uniref:NAC domain-containing protein n=1 Tax=Erythranthe guttata TaxID=4155 RepID=A0A022RSN3_ERYGU|nr:PREDICTED: NAC domain-containing protein 7-like [Erythranthe guttata]EYU43522.1 hypothetical protein MIMGU_mgv1a022938mg [Erythranthe guttata]|eukprot:XP_012829936.1 PREDICTED: NAC domain-containing protein 7-like [Erythranthe guttata]